MCTQHANDTDNVHLCRQCAETKLYMIGYIKSARDDIWMTLALSVRKNSSRNEMYITYASVDNIQMTYTVDVCGDNVWKLSCG